MRREEAIATLQREFDDFIAETKAVVLDLHDVRSYAYLRGPQLPCLS